MSAQVKIAIIGAGSAGLSALRQVTAHTDDYVMIDRGPLGTTCARTGCMPSKVLIKTARDFHRRHVFDTIGIRGANALKADIPAVLEHVRTLRDHFAGQMADTTRRLTGEHLLTGTAQLIAPNRIRVDQTEITADRIIIATGSAPLIPGPWKAFGRRILTSNTLFEQPDLPARIAVIGLGPIGLEIGQALSRLGMQVTGFDMKPSIAVTTDPAVNQQVLDIVRQEFPIYVDAMAELEEHDGQLRIVHPQTERTVDAVVAAVGAVPQLNGLGLENLGITLDEKGMPPVNPQTLQIADLPVFLAGDANGDRPILHEALDDGYIASKNATSEHIRSYCRRTRLMLIFTDPEIAVAGQAYEQLTAEKKSFVTGAADFAAQSRAVLELHNQGLIHVYAEPDTGRILGAEMICPDAEHLAHQLALAVQHGLTVWEMLHTPFYHPTVEEGLRSALQNAAGQLTPTSQGDRLLLCGSCPESPLR